MVLSYNIYVGNNADNINKVNKANTVIKTKAINPKEIQNLINPVFIVDYDSDIINCNYVTTDFTDYQYFINSISINTGGRMVLNYTIDPLSGFNFSNCPITVVRNGGIGAPTETPDTKLPVKPSSEDIKQIAVENGEFKALLNYPYVLQVIGG